jgi:hypothetical protein
LRYALTSSKARSAIYFLWDSIHNDSSALSDFFPKSREGRALLRRVIFAGYHGVWKYRRMAIIYRIAGYMLNHPSQTVVNVQDFVALSGAVPFEEPDIRRDLIKRKIIRHVYRRKCGSRIHAYKLDKMKACELYNQCIRILEEATKHGV